jgi:hypothetical protein
VLLGNRRTSTRGRPFAELVDVTSDTPTTALDIAQTVFEAKPGRTFDRAVQEFVHVLRTVPDGAPVEISGGTIQVFQHLAERVIEQIEQRLTGGHRRSVRENLAQAVSDIRHAVEEIGRWQRRCAAR